MSTLVWFRDDLRTLDHPALYEAASDPNGVIALYVHDEESAGTRPLGGAAKWWLHHSLNTLREDLAELGIPLVLRRGPAAQVLPAVIEEAHITRVVWNRRYGPERAIDAELKSALKVPVQSFPGSLLFEPHNIATASGTPYKVFTPIWRACLSQHTPAAPLPEPKVARRWAGKVPASDELHLEPTWPHEFAQTWQVGQSAALTRLAEFLPGEGYTEFRDFPTKNATSRLSPYLRWGEISPRTVFHAVRVDKFLSELGWREFAWYTFYHFPHMAHTNLDRRFDAMPWRDQGITQWQQGRTGFGLVDAGMRELWRTGTMHNRVRMVAASFLTKNLLVDWRVGEAWFWDTLVDADRASNPFNWQWVAGSGLDAAPYFRVFNPELQAKKFDPQGEYIAQYASVSPPIIDLRQSRLEALRAFDEI